MRSKLYILAALIISITAQHAAADVKVKVKQSVSGQSYENATYIKGKRQRSEQMGGTMVSITQCDLRRAIQMNPASKTFVVSEFGDIQTAETRGTGQTKNRPATKGGRVVTTINVKDTGERKQMFGFTARHLIITMDTQSTPDSCSKANSKMEMDGWYIDFEAAFDCDMYSQGGFVRGAQGGCQDKYEMKTTGTAKRGYPVYEKMTMFDESGKETMTMVSEVVELSKGTLDAALFEVPADYRQVKDSSEMYAVQAPAGRSSETADSPAPSSTFGSTAASMANRPGATPTTLGAKQAGIIRIGIADVKTGTVGQGVSAADLAAAVENTFVQYLKVPNIEVVPIEAKLASAIEAEAREKACDYVLYTSVAHKKGGGGFGKMFGSALGNAVSITGIGHTGSVAGNIAGQMAAQAVMSAANVSAQMKNKDELTLDIKLSNINTGTGLSKQLKAKAKSDGDDVISAAVEQAAQAIVDSLAR